MSTNTLIRTSMLAGFGVIAMTATACANGQTNSRYSDIHSYESGQNCGSDCAAAATVQHSSRYGSAEAVAPAPAYNAAPVYVDCTATNSCAPAAPVYAQPAPAPAYTYAQAQSGGTANCPAGTTAQPNGTCMQTSGSTSTYSSGTTYSAPTKMLPPVNCPAGTTPQDDGTCMQDGSWSAEPQNSIILPGTHISGQAYGSYSAEPVNCPAGTTAQPDGTCMQGGSMNSYADSAVEIYSGDAEPAPAPSYGYTSDGAYGPTDYLPIRK